MRILYNKNIIFTFIEHLQHPGTRLSPSHILSHLILTEALCAKYCDLYFTDEKTNRIVHGKAVCG